MTVQEYIDRIISLQKNRDYESAYGVLQDALNLYPSNKFLLASEVYLLLRLRKVKEARSKAEVRIVLLKDNPFFLRTYIEILAKDRDREEIINLSERLAIQSVRDEKLYAYLADTLKRIGERQRAIDLINSALSYMPGNRELTSCLDSLEEDSQGKPIDYYRERFKDTPPEKAIKEIESILVLPEYKDDISLRLFIAELYKKVGDLNRAAQLYTDCLKIRDSTHTRKMLGFLYYRMGDVDNAFFYFKDPFLENPLDHALYKTLSKIIEKRRDTKEAEALINEALARHPEARHLYGLLKKLRSRSKGDDRQTDNRHKTLP